MDLDINWMDNLHIYISVLEQGSFSPITSEKSELLRTLQKQMVIATLFITTFLYFFLVILKIVMCIVPSKHFFKIFDNSEVEASGYLKILKKRLRIGVIELWTKFYYMVSTLTILNVFGYLCKVAKMKQNIIGVTLLNK